MDFGGGDFGGWRRRLSSMVSLPSSRLNAAKAPSVSFDDLDEGHAPNPLIMFDWDDTLCPTWYIKRVVMPSTCITSLSDVQTPSLSKFEGELRAHAEVVVDVLRAAREVAKVVIVTLAEPGWLEACGEYLPGMDMRAVFKELSISVYYAEYTTKEVRESAWPAVAAKKEAMQEVIRKHYDHGTRWNVISIGDSIVEQEALKELCRSNRSGRICKTVKFPDDPNLSDLTEQLQALKPRLGKLVTLEKDFDGVGGHLK